MSISRLAGAGSQWGLLVWAAGFGALFLVSCARHTGANAPAETAAKAPRAAGSGPAAAGSTASAGEPADPPPVTSPPPPVESAPPRDDACPQALPAAAPADLRIRVSRTQIPRGKAPITKRVELIVGGLRCLRAPCVVISPETRASLWRAMVDGRVQQMRGAPVRRSPHFGSRFLWAAWGAHRCEVGDGSRMALDDGQVDVFDAIVRQVWDAARAGAPSPPRR